MTNSPSGAPFAQAALSSLLRFAGMQAEKIGQRAEVDGQRGVLALVEKVASLGLSGVGQPV